MSVVSVGNCDSSTAWYNEQETIVNIKQYDEVDHTWHRTTSR